MRRAWSTVVYACIHALEVNIATVASPVPFQSLDQQWRSESCSIDREYRPFLPSLERFLPDAIECPGKISSNLFSHMGAWKVSLNHTAVSPPPSVSFRVEGQVNKTVCDLNTIAVYSAGPSPQLRLMFDQCSDGRVIGMTVALRKSTTHDSKLLHWMCAAGAVDGVCCPHMATTTTTTTHEEGSADLHFTGSFASVHPVGWRSGESSFCSEDGTHPLNMDDGRYWFEDYDKHDCFKKCVIELASGGPRCSGFASPANSPNKGCYLHLRNFSRAVAENPTGMPFETHSKWEGLVNTSAVWMCYTLIPNQTEESIVVQVGEKVPEGQGDSADTLLQELSLCVEDQFLGSYDSMELLRVGSSNSSIYWFTLLDGSGDLIALPVSEGDWKFLFDDRCPLPQEPVTPCDCVASATRDPPECDQHWKYVAMVEFGVICALAAYSMYRCLYSSDPEPGKPEKPYEYQSLDPDVGDFTVGSPRSGLAPSPNSRLSTRQLATDRGSSPVAPRRR